MLARRLAIFPWMWVGCYPRWCLWSGCLGLGCLEGAGQPFWFCLCNSLILRGFAKKKRSIQPSRYEEDQESWLFHVRKLRWSSSWIRVALAFMICYVRLLEEWCRCCTGCLPSGWLSWLRDGDYQPFSRPLWWCLRPMFHLWASLVV